MSALELWGYFAQKRRLLAVTSHDPIEQDTYIIHTISLGILRHAVLCSRKVATNSRVFSLPGLLSQHNGHGTKPRGCVGSHIAG